MKNIIVNLLFLAVGAFITFLIMSHRQPTGSIELSNKEKKSSFNLAQHLEDVRSGRLGDSSEDQPQENEGVYDDTIPLEESAAANLEPDEYLDLIERVFSGDASNDEQLAFWEEMRKSDRIDELLNRLETNVSSSPYDVDSRLNLATVYMAKLHTGSMGPEMVVWASKAEQQWKEVLKVDPQNWEAQNLLAEGLSWYPDTMNRTAEAIGEYEKLISIQEISVPKQEFAESYLRLSQLYLRDGGPGGSLDAIERGLSVFPNDSSLLKQLSSLHNKYKFTEE